MSFRAVSFALPAVFVWCSLAFSQAGPYERLRPNPDSVASGRMIYARACINCHGLDVKGTENGPDLIRSVAVLRDDEGSAIGPAMGEASPHPSLDRSELVDVAHFLRQQIESTSRNRNPAMPPDVLTGNAEAGRSWFEGSGGCTACHSPAGDLAGIGARMPPDNLQQRLLFPRSGRAQPSRVTVTPETGPSGTGTLEFLDDFFVAWWDEDGVRRSLRRTPDLQVTVEDPYRAHWDLLERITDRELHDVVTYLGTLR